MSTAPFLQDDTRRDDDDDETPTLHHEEEDLQEGLDGPSYSDAAEWNEVFDGTLTTTSSSAKKKTPSSNIYKTRERIRYERAVIVAVIVAIMGAGIELSITKLSKWKYNVIASLTRREHFTSACFVLCGISGGFACLAGLAVMVAPKAKGSGIPEVKTYLNGVVPHPRVIGEATLFGKVAGIIFAVAGGLLCGKEGPMVHIGAIVGAIVAQGRAETPAFLYYSKNEKKSREKRPRPSKFKFLSCDREKVEFVAIGCACGVSSAFGSPVGGVLFMIEEALSFWKRRLFFRAAFAATVNCCVIVVLLSKFRTRHGFKAHTLKFEGMAVFDDFNGDKNTDYPSTLLLLCLAQGILIGLWGALFVESNRRLTLLRQKKLTRKVRKLVEVVAVALGTALTAYLPVVLTGQYFCRSLLDESHPYGADESYAERWHCEEGQYHELGTLTLVPLPRAIASLFHQKFLHAFSPLTLLYFFFYASLFTCVTYGINVPSGLFIPSILCGATFGRLFAVLALPLLYPNESHVNLGAKTQKLAIAGGIAGLAATTRMTVSIVVIFASTILDGANFVPILVSCLASKLAGDAFNEGLYDVHVHLNHYKFMEDEPPARLHDAKRVPVLKKLRNDHGARQHPDHTGQQKTTWSTDVAFVMTSPVATVRRLAPYAVAVDLLRNTTHHGFPVVDDAGAFAGLISRSQLAVVLKQAKLLASSSDDAGAYAAPTGSPPTTTRGQKTPAVVVDSTSPQLRARRSQNFGAGGRRTTQNRRQNSEEEEERKEITQRQYLLAVEDADARDFFPHFPRVADLPDAASFPPDAAVDLLPFANRSSPVVAPDANARYVWALFRDTRTRHVVVLDDRKRVVGIVTRSDLLGLSKPTNKWAAPTESFHDDHRPSHDDDVDDDDDKLRAAALLARSSSSSTGGDPTASTTTTATILAGERASDETVTTTTSRQDPANGASLV